MQSDSKQTDSDSESDSKKSEWRETTQKECPCGGKSCPDCVLHLEIDLEAAFTHWSNCRRELEVVFPTNSLFSDWTDDQLRAFHKENKYCTLEGCPDCRHSQAVIQHRVNEKSERDRIPSPHEVTITEEVVDAIKDMSPVEMVEYLMQRARDNNHRTHLMGIVKIRVTEAEERIRIDEEGPRTEPVVFHTRR